MSWRRALYSTVLTLLTPLAFARLAWKGRSNPDYRARWGERLGFIATFPVKPRLWIHAVSVGEVIAATPLIRAWQSQHPDWAILVTTTTPTGSAQLRRVFGETIEHVYLPYDLPSAVRRFFERTQPTLGVIMETELWPNLFAEAKRRGIPLVLANARLSERSMRGYAKVHELVAETLACVSLIAARDAQDVARFIALGASPDKVEALGNLKFDLELAPKTRERGEKWREMFGKEHKVWIAASTHPGEDEQVLAAHQQVMAQYPDALLLLAPRHPERAGDVAKLAEVQGLSLVRRSNFNVGANLSHLQQDVSVVLIDTLGELMDFYAASDVALVGGSLVAHGGHNPLEPLSLNLPVLSGASVFNFSEIYAAMQEDGLVTWVEDGASLAQALLTALDAAQPNQEQRGSSFLTRHSGALARLLVRLEA